MRTIFSLLKINLIRKKEAELNLNVFETSEADHYRWQCMCMSVRMQMSCRLYDFRDS